MLVHPFWSDLFHCMVVHARCGLFFTTASGKSFVATSQLHDALTKALIECFLVDSIVHLSSLRRRAALCYELRCGRTSGLPGTSSLPCGPAASTCEIIKVVPLPTLFSASSCVVASWCRELKPGAPHKDGWTHMSRLLHEVTN